jgi:Tfp pilus assembly protein PilV
MHLTKPNTADGFILLEVLVAMSLILGAWMTSVSAYQQVALRFNQQESKHAELRTALDAYELAEQFRANTIQPILLNSSNISSKDMKNESSRVSGRNRALYPATKSTAKNQR